MNEHSSRTTADRVLAHLADDPLASQRAVAAALGIGRSTVARAVRRLVAQGDVEVYRRGTGAGIPTWYQVRAHRQLRLVERGDR
jgi:DNA-binding MarR family transcriptional regulator